MLVTVVAVGDQFTAYDPQGTKITNREILEQIAFEPMPVYKGEFTVNIDIDNIRNPVTMDELKINIDVKTQR